MRLSLIMLFMVYIGIEGRRVKGHREKGISCINLVDTEEDISLRKRTDKANDIWRKEYDKGGKPCIYVSVHANGFNKESANGWSVYTSVGETKIKLHKSLLKRQKQNFPITK